METTLGGDRLGSGNRQKIHMKNFERSTHDLGYLWRSTAAPGTLIPFLSEVGLPGDTFDIDLNVNVMTHPTIGPLFGSYKIQMDVFSVPIRLYNAELHMNKLGIGMNMSNILLPQLQMEAQGNKEKYNDNSQINPSSIYSYLNIRGLGLSNGDEEVVYRKFNGIPYLAYWDIYKNYYANKQEEVGYVIHNPMNSTYNGLNKCTLIQGTTETNIPLSGAPKFRTLTVTNQFIFEFNTEIEPTIDSMIIDIDGSRWNMQEVGISGWWNQETKKYTWDGIKSTFITGQEISIASPEFDGSVIPTIIKGIQLTEFPLDNIDLMRTQILQNPTGTQFIIDYTTQEPYNLGLKKGNLPETDFGAYSKLSTQEGLGIKTYQSDLFNNWIQTEWIDGDNGINAVTAIDTTEGSFTIDTLNLSNKVYNMLNRIALSGGSYDDWLDAVYSHDRAKSIENPMYMGSLIRELAFEEVVSNAGTTEQPLGTLAGRGALTGKKKGGTIRIRVDEPSYIMGLFSLTPKLDYSQGNKWDVNLKNMNDFHKPSLDEIGFQDLITDQMAWFDTVLTDDTDDIIYKSAGKQPAWINYMTNVNTVRGNFAEETEQMWMTLNRKYEKGVTGIEDLTTYIDPAKYNHIFADTRLDAQNFWVQISVDNTARRKMSAKVIPNL